MDEVKRFEVLLDEARASQKSAEQRAADEDQRLRELKKQLTQAQEDQRARKALELRKEILALENEVLELQEKLTGALESQTADTVTRTLKQRDKDHEDYYADSYDNKSSRKHPFEIRVQVHRLLALGVLPPALISIMRQFGALGEGPVPKLNWVYTMRQESRILVPLLAAAAAAAGSA